MSRENETVTPPDRRRIAEDPPAYARRGAAELAPEVQDALAILTGHLQKIARHEHELDAQRMKKRAPLSLVVKKPA